MGQSRLVRLDFGFQFSAARHSRLMIAAACLGVIGWLALSSYSPAVVVISDNFDDADRDNDGTTDIDTNNDGFVNDDDDNTAVTSPDGIKWFSADGTFFGGLSHPLFSIVNDNVPGGFNTDNALKMLPFQSSPDVTGFFGQRIALGQNLGDKLVVSFDWRTTDTVLPSGDGSGIRFGLWQDTDNQIGMQGPDRDGTTLKTWGESDGYFEGKPDCATSQPVGVCGDYGIWSRIKVGATGAYNPVGDATANMYFINEEVNADIAPGGNDVDSTDTIIQLTDASTDPHPSTIPVPKNAPSTISLTLERVAPNANGVDVRYDVAIDGVSFGAQETAVGDVMTSNDGFDYFWLVNINNVQTQLIDNFKVELIEADSGLDGDHNEDGNVDAADYVAWRKDPASFDGDPDGYNTWRENFGASSPAAGGSAAVPEPASFQCTLLLLCGAFLGYRPCHRKYFRTVE